jgi:hypothetical protein
MGDRLASRTAIAATVTALVLPLTGCLGDVGGSSSGGSGGAGGAGGNAAQLTPVQLLTQSVQKTGNSDTYTAQFSMAMKLPSVGTTQMRGTIRTRLKPSLAFNFKISKMTIGGRQPLPGGVQVRLVGKSVYVGSPALARRTGGKPWIKVPASKLGKQFRDLRDQADQMDPRSQVQMMTASKDVREAGKKTVGGVQTTHFTGTYRTEEALGKLSAEQRASAQKAIKQAGLDRLGFDLWLDDQQLPRQMTVKSPNGAKTKLRMTMIFRDYGKPLKIGPPAPGSIARGGPVA